MQLSGGRCSWWREELVQRPLGWECTGLCFEDLQKAAMAEAGARGASGRDRVTVKGPERGGTEDFCRD